MTLPIPFIPLWYRTKQERRAYYTSYTVLQWKHPSPSFLRHTDIPTSKLCHNLTDINFRNPSSYTIAMATPSKNTVGCGVHVTMHTCVCEPFGHDMYFAAAAQTCVWRHSHTCCDVYACNSVRLCTGGRGGGPEHMWTQVEIHFVSSILAPTYP